MNNPALSISVVIPVYNGEKFIQRCLDSVFAQTRPAQEIIVIDDGSNDGTNAVLARNAERITVISQRNRGRSEARNAGMARAQGDYIAFLDADDEYLPDHLKHLTDAAMQSGADILYDWIGAPYFRAGDRLPRKPDGRRAYRHISNYQLIIVNSMVRRDFVVRSGIKFDMDLSIGEDALFFWKLIALGATVKFIRVAGSRLGLHENNTTADPVRSTEQSMLAYTRFIEFLDSHQVEYGVLYKREAYRGICSLKCKADLYRIYIAGKQRDVSLSWRLVQHLFSLKPIRAVDRARCFLALLWSVCPLCRNRTYERIVYGYGVAGRHWHHRCI
jgi:glycosyltransferase involved in cell wall biosynthesis